MFSSGVKGGKILRIFLKFVEQPGFVTSVLQTFLDCPGTIEMRSESWGIS